MKLVTIEDLKDGDIIANDVLLEDYTVVLGKGTVIKKQYVDKLREFNVYTVYIEDGNPAENKKAEKKEIKKELTKKLAAGNESTPNKAEAVNKNIENKRPKLPVETVTILRDDVEEQVKNNIRDILELHIYQRTSGLEKIAETAQNIISDILEEDEVIEKVYDVKERSADIYEHSLQVCTISTLIALKLGMTQQQVYDISVSALIHDLGLRYLVVRYENQDINLLPAKDQEEYRKHPIYGYTAIKNEKWLSEQAKEIVLNHHERKDGSGYSLGTDLISRMTQIIGVCDEFDELICGIGKARVRVHEAINNIRNYSGIWFDSDIVDAFLQLIAVYPSGTKVITNQGERGVVLRQNAHFPERPIIRITHDKSGQYIKEEKTVDLIKNTSVVIQNVIK